MAVGIRLTEALSEETRKNVDGELWLLYSAAIQSGGRAIDEMRTSSTSPVNGPESPKSPIATSTLLPGDGPGTPKLPHRNLVVVPGPHRHWGGGSALRHAIGVGRAAGAVTGENDILPIAVVDDPIRPLLVSITRPVDLQTRIVGA